MEEIELLNNHRYPEIHTIIFWNGKIDNKIIKKVLNKSNIKSKFDILFNQKIKMNKDQQVNFICSVYIKNKTKINKIQQGTIRLIIIKDRNPIYDLTDSTTCTQVLNSNMKKIKLSLRKEIGGDKENFRSVHTSYNVEESILVLKPLNLTYFIPRVRFKNFYDFFNLLNSDKRLKYVILFDYNILHCQINKINNKKNIKFLVNDYYYFKSIIGARSTDKINMRENDNGFNVNNNIIINNCSVTINIRYISDNYFCNNWERNILNNSDLIQISSYFIKIPNYINQYYTHLYHIIIHKNFNYNKNLDFIEKKIEKPFNKQFLIDKLKSFINKKKYKVVKSIDKFVQFYNLL